MRMGSGRLRVLARRALGQSLIDYVILIGVVVGALGAMQTYVRRGLQARMYDALRAGKSEPRQYEPHYLTAESQLAVKTVGNYTFHPDSVTGEGTITAESRCWVDTTGQHCPQQQISGDP